MIGRFYNLMVAGLVNGTITLKENKMDQKIAEEMLALEAQISEIDALTDTLNVEIATLTARRTKHNAKKRSLLGKHTTLRIKLERSA